MRDSLIIMLTVWALLVGTWVLFHIPGTQSFIHTHTISTAGKDNAPPTIIPCFQESGHPCM